jgi:hypothetical protein
MTEIQLIREQLARERAHATAVARAGATALGSTDAAQITSGSPLDEFRQRCVDYLVCVLASFEERDLRLAELVRARQGADDPARRALEEVLSRRGRSRETLEQLEAAFAGSGAPGARAAPAGWGAFLAYFDSAWSARRDALEALLASNPRVSDWRTVGGIDADSILEERRRFARVRDTLPSGVTLDAAPA